MPDQQMPLSPSPEVKLESSHKTFFIALLVIIILGGGFFFFSEYKNAFLIEGTEQSPAPTQESVPREDVSVQYFRVTESDNSAKLFRSVDLTPISKTDIEFIGKYALVTATNTPPLAEAKAILSKHKNLLSVFEEGVQKTYYQCSFWFEANCPANSVRRAAQLAVLNAYVLFKDGKAEEAREYSKKIITLGEKVTANTDSMLDLLVGWTIQRMGYGLFPIIEADVAFAAEEKEALVRTLREEHKKVLKFEFSNQLEYLDYVTDVTDRPSGILDQNDEDFLGQFRMAADETTWKPEEIKEWMTDSLMISLSNVDLPCGSPLRRSQLDLGFDPKNIKEKDNYVGKAFYMTVSAPSDLVNEKRCEVENLIPLK